MDSKFCPDCGQKRARRFGARDVTGLAWENLRRFEFNLFEAMLRVAVAPGRVARNYVLGARGRTIHPFKLLLTTIVFLILLISKTGYHQTEGRRGGRSLHAVPGAHQRSTGA